MMNDVYIDKYLQVKNGLTKRPKRAVMRVASGLA